MRWKTHRAVGVFSYSAIIAFMPCLQVNPLAPLGLITAYHGSVLPDLIEPKDGHRSYGHSLLYAFIFCGVCYLIGRLAWPLESLAYGYIGSVLSHLLTDAFTDNGIPAFWPLDKRRINPGRLRLWFYAQGKLEEEKLSFVAWLIVTALWFKFLFLFGNQWINELFDLIIKYIFNF